MKRAIAPIVIALLTVIDVITKQIVLARLYPIGSVELVRGIFGLRYVENTGAVFGSFSNYSVLLSVITSIIIAVGLILLIIGKIKPGIQTVCAVLIISGGLGNLIDRLVRGYVVDFFEFLFFDFAVFNVADIFVTVGSAIIIVYLIYDLIQDSRKNKGKNKEQADEQS